MSSHNIDDSTPSDDWEDIFKGGVEKNDPVWKEYLKEAALFDTRLVDEWNKILDVVLVFVALFTSVLTAFVIGTSSQFQRDPADISNDLLFAIYVQLAALSNNTSVTIIDHASFFNQTKTHLALSAIISIISVTAKLWLVSYSKRVFSVGSPYERAMRRQEAYNGVLEWNLGAVIDALPLLLLVSLFLFAIFIHKSIAANQSLIGYVVGVIFILGLVFILLTSIAAAFISACPFRSSLSTFVYILFKAFPDFKLSRKIVGNKLSRLKPGPVRMGLITLLSVGSLIATPICIMRYSSAFYALFCFPVAGAFAVSMEQEKADCGAQKYKLPECILFMFLTIAPLLVASGYFYSNSHTFPVFITLFCVASILIALFGLFVARMSKENTGEVDAISWLLKTTSAQKPSFFKKAAQIAGSPSGHNYAARLLASLTPLLSPLITSHTEVHHSNNSQNKDTLLKDLEIYVACLARFSDFSDEEGSFWANKASKVHPVLQDSLHNKLVEFEKSTDRPRLSAAATKVLNNYGLKVPSAKLHEGQVEENPSSLA